MENKITNYNSLDDSQKINYVKNLLFNSNLNDALDSILKDEKKDLKWIKIIKDVLNEKLMINRIKEQCNLNDDLSAKAYVYSRILAILDFYKKTVILNAFFKNLNEDEIKMVANYEYQNKTNVSFNNKIFNKYCLKYKESAINEIKVDDAKIKKLDIEKERYNALSDKKMKIKKKINIIPFIISFVILLFLFGVCYKLYGYNKLIKKYDGLIYPGIYLNDIDLSGNKESELSGIIKHEKERIENGTITVTSPNGDHKFTYKELGILVDDSNLEGRIKKYNDNLSYFKKIKLIKKNNKKMVFNLKASYDNNTVDTFMNVLENKLNSKARGDGIVVDENHNVYYDKGSKGFTLDTQKTREKVETALLNLTYETVIEASGKTIDNEVKYEALSSINQKISSYTTYFQNAGNRGHNINLAVGKLNNTVLMPGDTFSYLKVVGTYGASNGYLPAPIYLNSEVSTANGGGVCQLASTLYMAQLLAGLKTVSRKGHTFAPNYVPKGLDATVYSTTTDYKFKNEYSYPVYIVSYVKGNYLTVDIWSNSNAAGGKTFEPYSLASNGGWLAYLRIKKDGKVIETKYLDRTVYKTH